MNAGAKIREICKKQLGQRVDTIVQVFHWSRQAGNYAF